MPHQPQIHTAVSAPGKVLLTGGYLVLDRAYTGTVFALDARIHVIVQQLSRSGTGVGAGNVDGEQVAGAGEEEQQGRGGQEGEADEDCRIVVRSPQFIDAVWEYGIERIDGGGGVKVVQIGDTPRNPFVETALNYSLTYISYVAASKHFGSLSITILADNDYYSETETSKGPAASSRGHFAQFGVTLRDAHKTGLGSSAALVTALASAVVIHRTMHADDLDVAREKLHNLAQAAHCAAQGKVGSGFDVAAAVYGTCLYRRFSPSVLGSLGEVGSPQFEERLFTTIEDLDPEHPWDAECIDFGTKLPRGMQMVLCDVDCGSQTPSMVRKVLEWRENNREEADKMWAELQFNNEKLRQELKRLAQPPAPVQDYAEVRALLCKSRAYIRSMTQKSGVPIEPRVQKELLDALSEVDGVIGGIVPGAGGYDAIAVLIRDDAQFVEAIRKFLEGWKSSEEDDFGGKIERVRLLGVRHGSEGVRNESPRQYAGWIH